MSTRKVDDPVIGILAGMGPRSTGPFIDLVVTQCQQQYGARHDIDFPKMLILSQPAPFYEDRPTDHAALETAIREGLLHLQSAGAAFLAIACNTAHIYYESLAAAVEIDLLNIVELAAQAVPGSAQKIALIAARPTVESGIFQDAIHARGHVLQEIDWQDEVDSLLAATRESTDPALFGRLWASLLERAQAAGVDTVLVACLDLSGVLRYAATGLHLIDAADCLARAVVAEWLARRNRTMTDRDLLTRVYEAFNARNIDAILPVMHPEVDWPNGWEGGRMVGRPAVREYWTRQWAAIDPRVEPVGFETDEAGRTVVKVHQTVRDLEGNLMVDGVVEHVYVVEDGLVKSMEIREA